MTPHLSYDATNERIAELQAVAASTHGTSLERSAVEPPAGGALDRVRDAVGLALIRLGAALVREEHRPGRLVRP